MAAAPVVVVEQQAQVLPTQATVVVQLPADAVLYVDKQRSPQTSSQRTIVTPVLTANKEYVYTIKAEALRDGKMVEKIKKVTFRAGQVVRVNLDDLKAADLSQKRMEASASRVTVRLPEDAKLYVDGVACPLTSNTRSFDTPELQAGQKYYYTIKAEIVRDGQPRSETRKVLVQAGKAVDVDLRDLDPVVTARR